MGLEYVLAVEDAEAFGICALGSEEDVRSQMHGCRRRGRQLVGISRHDGCFVSEA